MWKWIVGLCLICFSSLGWTFSQTNLVEQLQQPKTVQGHFIQQRFLKALAKPITTSGQFTLVQNKGLLWQMQKPFQVDLRVIPSGISQWNNSHWVATTQAGQAQQITLFLGLLTGDVEGLKSQFDMSLSGQSTNWQLTLIPRSLLMKQIFERIHIQGDKVVKMIELYEKQGDHSTISFTQIQLDQPLSDFAQRSLE